MATTDRIELLSGEEILWSGRPKAGFTLHRYDFWVLPFSLGLLIIYIFVFGGSLIYPTTNLWQTVAALSIAFPCMLIAFQVSLGRFIIEAAVRSKTDYAVTNKRLIFVSGRVRQSIRTRNLDSIEHVLIEDKGNGSGTIDFDWTLPTLLALTRDLWPPPMYLRRFVAIKNARTAYDTILRAQEKMKA